MNRDNSPATNLNLEEAIEKILAAIPAPVNEMVAVESSVDRFVTASVSANVSLPGFDNSSMDGYAVQSVDTCKASAENPVALRLAGRIEAGNVPGKPLSSGECIRIFTGSPMPEGADAVAMQEDTSVDPARPDTISFLDKVTPWENVRLVGEDVRKGDILCEAGTKVTPALIALLQASGVTAVPLAKRPSVALLATGSELVETGQPLPHGKIYESNRAMLAALAEKAGAIVRIMPLVKDSLSDTATALEQSFSQSDIVITSGGVSVGEMDFVKPAFERLGGTLDFWKVAIKPGRPFVFGKLGSKLLMGLPGNPVSAFVTFLLLVRPAILQWQNAFEIGLPIETGTLAEGTSNEGSRRHFIRVRKDSNGLVHPAGVQASHVLSSLALSNALLDLPPHCHLEKGSAVKLLCF